MTTLFFKPGACSLAPHIVLEWIGAPYEAIRVQPGSQELLALNPTGAVPTLREADGWILTQAGAILDYLAQKHPEANLGGGSGIRTKAEAHKWSSFLTSDLHASFWPVFMAGRFTTDPSEEAKTKVVEAALLMLGKKFTILNDHLAGRDWFLDGGRSIIDAYAFPMIRWGIAKVPNFARDYPHVQALHDRLAADPQVQKVLAEEKSA